MWKHYLEWEKKCSLWLKDRSITYLRISIALIYFWFGIFKVLGIMPTSLETMIFHATEWMKMPLFLYLLGVWEMLIGVFLVVKKWQRWGLFLLFLQMPGTFLPLFIYPQEYFIPLPFGLTLEAQYILKNLVYIAGALVVVSSLHEGEPEDKSSS